MNRFTPHRFAAFTLALVALTAGTFATAFAVSNPTPTPTSAIVKTRIFNDCPTSTVTVVNNYPSLISIDDSNVDCFGFANLHVWRFSTDGTTEAAFDNNASYRFSADFKIEGSGNGEGGLQVSPWWSHDTDGLFNVRSTDGEIACFGGRLPFYSFTGSNGLHYAKGNTIRLGIVYEPRALNAGRPATITYTVDYLGTHYSSPALPFDQANPAEDPPHGLFGELNDARVGGAFKAFLGQGTAVNVKASFSNIAFSTTPVPNSVVLKTRIFNDCPTSYLVTNNQYPSIVQIWDQNLDCFGFANLHNWRFSENGTDAAIFNNNAEFRFTAEFQLMGTGNGEGGLAISPWFSKDVDGRFNVRSTDGEIACFGGRLPFYSFTASQGVHYVKGTYIHMEIMYAPNGRSAASPATIEYKIGYNNQTYTSGPLPFDGANPAEDPPYGVYGMLNDGQAGGYVQAFLTGGTPTDLMANWSDITWSTCVHPTFVYCEVYPHNFVLDSHAQLMYVTLEPTDDHTASDINISSIAINGVHVSPLKNPRISNHNTKLTVWFDRAAVAATLAVGPHQKPVITGDIGDLCFDEWDYINVYQHRIRCGHDHLTAGATELLSWDLDASLNASKLTLVASRDQGMTWTTEATNIPNTGSYTYHVPSTPAANLQLALVSGIVNTGDASDGVIADMEHAASLNTSIVSSPLGVGTEGVAFSLRVPNPVSGKLTTSFSLPSSAAAELSVFDIAGRSVDKREVGGRAGAQSVTLGRLPAGLYLVRLTQSGEVLSKRVAVIQ